MFAWSMPIKSSLSVSTTSAHRDLQRIHEHYKLSVLKRCVPKTLLFTFSLRSRSKTRRSKNARFREEVKRYRAKSALRLLLAIWRLASGPGLGFRALVFKKAAFCVRVVKTTKMIHTVKRCRDNVSGSVKRLPCALSTNSSVSKCSATPARIAATPPGARPGFGGPNYPRHPTGVQDGMRQRGVAATPLETAERAATGVATRWSTKGGGAGIVRRCPSTVSCTVPSGESPNFRWIHS